MYLTHPLNLFFWLFPFTYFLILFSFSLFTLSYLCVDLIYVTLRKEAQVEMEGSFLVRIIYEDRITYSLIQSAEKVLNMPANSILELFGWMFFEFCQESGYDKILRILGATTKDFLQNLDALHDHLATIYPGMRAPSFRCTESPETGALILHYYSERPGLEHIVIGIVKVRKERKKKFSPFISSFRSFFLSPCSTLFSTLA